MLLLIAGYLDHRNLNLEKNDAVGPAENILLNGRHHDSRSDVERVIVIGFDSEELRGRDGHVLYRRIGNDLDFGCDGFYHYHNSTTWLIAAGVHRHMQRAIFYSRLVDVRQDVVVAVGKYHYVVSRGGRHRREIF